MSDLPEKEHLIYQKSTFTIRQMPQNYIIAWHSLGGRWTVDPDIACNTELAVKLFTLCLNYSDRYSPGQVLVDKVMRPDVK